MNNTVKIGIGVGAGIVISLVILVFSDPVTIEPLELETPTTFGACIEQHIELNTHHDQVLQQCTDRYLNFLGSLNEACVSKHVTPIQTEIDNKFEICKSLIPLNDEETSSSTLGVLGDEHAHAEILVIINGNEINFSLPIFQLNSKWIHFENFNGKTIHRHSSGATLGYFFDTLGTGLTDNCFVYPNGDPFCSTDAVPFEFYINQELVPSIRDYIIQEDDKITIKLGSGAENEPLRVI